MGLSYYDDRRKPKNGIATALMVINALMAFGMVFYWSGLAGLIAEPFKWAMRDGVSISPALFEYPYIVLWLTPTLCVVAGWLAIKANRASVARLVGGYPSMMLILMLGWFNYAPSHWL